MPGNQSFDVRQAERRRAKQRDTYQLYSGDIATLIGQRRAEDGPRIVVTPNVDHLRLLHKSRSFRRAYSGADLVLNDSRVLDLIAYRGRARHVPGSDLAPQILDSLAEGSHVVVVGGGEEMGTLLRERHPFLNILVVSPSMGYIRRRAERRSIAETIAEFEPDYVFICTGAPQSEILAVQLKKELDGPCDLVCCGSALQFDLGISKRAPARFRALGLEWAWRAWHERRTRLRYLKDAGFLAGVLAPLLMLRWKRRFRVGGVVLQLGAARAKEFVH